MESRVVGTSLNQANGTIKNGAKEINGAIITGVITTGGIIGGIITVILDSWIMGDLT